MYYASFGNSATFNSQSRRLHGSWPFQWFVCYNSCGTEKCPLAVNGSPRTEHPPDPFLYGGRLYGGSVNSAVKTHTLPPFPPPRPAPCRLFPSVPLTFDLVKLWLPKLGSSKHFGRVFLFLYARNFLGLVTSS